MIILQKKDENAQQVNIPACLSCYLGVTEPAIFGVNLKYEFPFFCAMIGSAIAGTLCCAFGVHANSIGVGGLPGILSINSAYFAQYALCMLVAVVVPFVLTFMVGKRQGIDKQAELVALGEGNALDEADMTQTTEKIASLTVDGTLRAAVSGTVKPLADVADGVFSAGMMGEGIAIDPTEGEIVAPCEGEVAVMMKESGHAVGLRLANGLEVLIHVGLDTVEMKGDGFTCHVDQGDVVHLGDPLISFDRAKIAAAGYKDTVMEIITEQGQAKDIKLVETGDAKAGETTVVTFA